MQLLRGAVKEMLIFKRDGRLWRRRRATRLRSGSPEAQNDKGGPKGPELCIKTVIRLCTGISQNHHPCLLTLPFRTGRYLLFPKVD